MQVLTMNAEVICTSSSSVSSSLLSTSSLGVETILIIASLGFMDGYWLGILSFGWLSFSSFPCFLILALMALTLSLILGSISFHILSGILKLSLNDLLLNVL